MDCPYSVFITSDADAITRAIAYAIEQPMDVDEMIIHPTLQEL